MKNLKVWAAVLAAGCFLAGCASPTVAQLNPAAYQSANSTTALVPAGVTRANVLADAHNRVTANLAQSSGFTPPSTGPAAQHKGGTIVYVAADLTNSGINTVAQAVKQAGAAIGWQVDVIDGQGSAQGRSNALAQAIALHPIGIIDGGFDATEQAANIKQATSQGIPVVGWHAGPSPGPMTSTGVFTNVTTDPLQVAWLAAAYAVAQSGGHAGVAIFTDSEYQIAVQKAQAMRDYVNLCAGCKVLAYDNAPIATAATNMPSQVSGLLQQYGSQLNWLLGINGNYFGAAKSALHDAGKPGSGPPYGVAAGDGTQDEFQRIGSSDYQAATVAEPLILQGWQLVDELNRALAGQQPSGFVVQPALITAQNVPANGVFDPSSGYRQIYQRVWAG